MSKPLDTREAANPMTHPIPAVGLTDEKLRQIIEGCEGVTPGPWSYEKLERDGFNGEHYTYYDGSAALLGPKTDDETVPILVDADAAHIARLDPQTVIAMASELLSLRSAPVEVKELIETLEAQGYDVLRPSAARAPQWRGSRAETDYPEPPIRYVEVDRSLLEAACDEIEEWKVGNGGDDQVLLNLRAVLAP